MSKEEKNSKIIDFHTRSAQIKPDADKEEVQGEETSGEPVSIEELNAEIESIEAERAGLETKDVTEQPEMPEEAPTIEELNAEIDHIEAEKAKAAAKAEEKGALPEETRKKNKRFRPGKKSLLALLLVLACVVGGVLYNRYAPNTKHMGEKEYYEWMLARAKGEESASLAEDEAALVLGREVAAEAALVKGEEVYLPYNIVRSNIFTRFYYDEPNAVMLYTTQDDTWNIPLNSAVYTTKDGEASYEAAIFISDARGIYINAGFLARYVNLTSTLSEDGYHVWVQYEWGEQETVTAKKKSTVRFGNNIKQMIVAEAAKGDLLYVLGKSESGDWMRVLTQDGHIGWIQSSRLTESEKTEITHEFEEETITGLTSDEMINLVWHQISSEDGNRYFTSDTAGTSGINVISPTWLSLTDNNGNFSSYASKSYVTKAHKKGWQVWGLVDNFSANMSTAELVASTQARTALITNLITEALKVGMDGINIDFETIAEEAGYSYVQFIRELSVACRANHLVLSVDVPVPRAFSTHYDRSELGVFCDYVIMMGYDEHYAGSDAGSVASLSFEETGIQDTLKDVPANKLISAVPFYTRLWYTDVSGNVWSEAYGMDTISTTLDTYDVTTVWNEDTQQNYGEWTLDDGTVCQVWIEDETSLALKAKLVADYDLGGIAAWALGFERDNIWSVLSENIA